MTEQLKKLEVFQQLTGQTDINRRIPTVEERKLRLKLALEELEELAEAYGLDEYFIDLKDTQSVEKEEYYFNELNSAVIDSEVYNQIEVLDALVDINYINNGTVVTSGLQNIFDEAFDLVHANNMTKFHTSIYEANKTFFHHSNLNTKCEVVEIIVNDEIYFIVKNKSGKILKPYNFESVNLKPLLDETN